MTLMGTVHAKRRGTDGVMYVRCLHKEGAPPKPSSQQLTLVFSPSCSPWTCQGSCLSRPLFCGSCKFLVGQGLLP